MENEEPKPADPRQKHKGWYEIGGKRMYLKSKWEINFAYYLEWLKGLGEILNWEYEPDKFWFDGIKSGVTNYTPDFKILHKKQIKYIDEKGERMSDIEYCEVKGFMDSKSLTKLKRMRIYHKHILIRIIDSSWFKDNAKKLRGIVPGWKK